MYMKCMEEVHNITPQELVVERRDDIFSGRCFISKVEAHCTVRTNLLQQRASLPSIPAPRLAEVRINTYVASHCHYRIQLIIPRTAVITPSSTFLLRSDHRSNHVLRVYSSRHRSSRM